MGNPVRRTVAAAIILALAARMVDADKLRDFGLAAAAVGLFAALASDSNSEGMRKDLLVLSSGVATEPSFGDESTSAPGSPIFSVYTYEEFIAARFGGGIALRTVEDPQLYCLPDSSRCWRDTNNDGSFERTIVAGALKGFPPTQYSTENVRLNRAERGFRYELLYQGRVNGVLRLTYREYVEDMARPAFSQEIAYETTVLPASIAFRDINIEVLAADNMAMRYQVSGDPSSWPQNPL